MNRAFEACLHEAADWRLLGLLFEHPSGTWREQVEALAGETSDPALRESAARALQQATEGLYCSIFGPGGPAPPREASYLTGAQPGYLLAELNSLYEAFGYQPVLDESPDHVAVQTGFVAYLKLKQAYAAAAGTAGQEERCQEGIRYMIGDHLRNMAGPLTAILEASGPPYLRLASRALLERVGPSGEQAPLANACPEPAGEDSEFVCGAAGSADVPLVQFEPPGDPHEL